MYVHFYINFRRGDDRAAVQVTASTAAAVIKFIEASAGLTNGAEDLSEKDAQDRHQAMMAKLTLHTFDDEDDEFSPK